QRAGQPGLSVGGLPGEQDQSEGRAGPEPVPVADRVAEAAAGQIPVAESGVKAAGHRQPRHRGEPDRQPGEPWTRPTLAEADDRNGDRDHVLPGEMHQSLDQGPGKIPASMPRGRGGRKFMAGTKRGGCSGAVLLVLILLWAAPASATPPASAQYQLSAPS